MSIQRENTSRPCALLLVATFVLVQAAFTSTAQAQLFGRQQVGGVSIDPNGLLSKIELDQLNELKRVRQEAFAPVPDGLQDQGLRKISLRGLEAAIAELHRDGLPLTDEIRYLGGLQRIQYVLVYPERNDIVIAGPAEGWKLNALGEVVGLTTDRPVLLLDDLLVSLRAIEGAQATGILCSIDPTNEGLARSAALIKRLTNPGSNIEPVLRQLEEAVGPQTITVKGVPDTSHFARVLVAADYRMKRIAMGFDESPVRQLPSYLQMLSVSSARQAGSMPRWWLEPTYDAILADADGLAFEFRGASVKAMTEDQYLDANGQRKASGRVDGMARKWSDLMTRHYDELSRQDAIFGQLRNCIDMAVLAALIHKENLAEKVHWSMPLLLDTKLQVERHYPARQVASQASAVHKNGAWILSVSGGVMINPWQLVNHVKQNPELATLRKTTTPPAEHWCWN